MYRSISPFGWQDGVKKGGRIDRPIACDDQLPFLRFENGIVLRQL